MQSWEGKQDSRHHNLKIKLQDKHSTPFFVEWGVGFRELSKNLENADFSTGQRHAIRLPEQAEPRTYYVYLASFRENWR